VTGGARIRGGELVGFAKQESLVFSISKLLPSTGGRGPQSGKVGSQELRIRGGELVGFAKQESLVFSISKLLPSTGGRGPQSGKVGARKLGNMAGSSSALPNEKLSHSASLAPPVTREEGARKVGR
jgi:hypothetical protein